MWNRVKFVIGREQEIHISPSQVESVAPRESGTFISYGDDFYASPVVKYTQITLKSGNSVNVHESEEDVNRKLNRARWCERFVVLVLSIVAISVAGVLLSIWK